MALDHHRNAEELLARGDAARAEGSLDQAREFWLQASDAEALAFELVPAERVRTRGVLAVAVVALLDRAGQRDRALSQCIRYLALGDLPDAAQKQLFELLDDLRDIRALSVSEGRAEQVVEWTLQGPAIGHGTAPAASVAGVFDHIYKYGLRVAEMLSDVPLRLRGDPDAKLLNAVRLNVKQPVAGSFRFRTAFSVLPIQTDLLSHSPSLDPTQLEATFSGFLDAVATPDSDRGLADLAPDASYRTTLLRLARQLIPDGREIEVIELSGPATPSVRLTRAARRRVDRILEAQRPTLVGSSERTGILRALDLDSRSIELAMDGQPRSRCTADNSALVLEDIIGPLVNKRVRVIGRWNRRQFVFSEILEDEALDAAN